MRWNELIGEGGDVLAVMEDGELARTASGGRFAQVEPLPDGPGGLRRWLVVEGLSPAEEDDE